MTVSFMMTLVPGSKYLLYLKIRAYANKLQNPCARVLVYTFGISTSVRLRKKIKSNWPKIISLFYLRNLMDVYLYAEF